MVRDNPAMTEDSGPPPEDPGPPPPQPPPSGRPGLGDVPGQPYPPPGHAGWSQPAVPTYAYPVYVRPDLPKAVAAMVVGIVAVAGGLMLCGLPLLASPVAWVLGAQARRQIRESPHRWGGEGKATAGLVLGIIGTILLLLAVAVLVVVVVLAVSDPSTFDSGTGV